MAERQQPEHPMEEMARPTRRMAHQMERQMHEVSEQAREMEERTGMDAVMRAMAYVPTYVYYGSLMASIGASLSLYLTGRRWTALFVGLWAPTILNLGMFNKMQRHVRP